MLRLPPNCWPTRPRATARSLREDGVDGTGCPPHGRISRFPVPGAVRATDVAALASNSTEPEVRRVVVDRRHRQGHVGGLDTETVAQPGEPGAERFLLAHQRPQHRVVAVDGAVRSASREWKVVLCPRLRNRPTPARVCHGMTLRPSPLSNHRPVWSTRILVRRCRQNTTRSKPPGTPRAARTTAATSPSPRDRGW